MCGISGIAYRQGAVNPNTLGLSADALFHRGPDSGGTYISADQKLGFAHRRLSFLDLSESGRQPLHNAEGNITVTYNGEIYNFRELRHELENMGYVFRTQTDTEVVLHAYHAWGADFPKRLKGMFALALYDSTRQKLILLRDRFGIKPLFYALADGVFAFGSEIKAMFVFPEIKKEIRKKSVGEFLANRYVPTPHTMWENIYKLPPAHMLELDLQTFRMHTSVYWQLSMGNGKPHHAQEQIGRLLGNAVAQHLRSDVPVGTFLSGGMDSTTLLCLMKQQMATRPDAFSIGFEDWPDSEHQYAALAANALGADLHTLMLSKISLHVLPKLMYHYDDPIADISILPTYAVSGLASAQVKAVLSGEGADECFGGYWWQQPARFFYANKWWKRKARLFGKSFGDIKRHYVEAMSMGLYDKAELGQAFTETWKDAAGDDPFAHLDRFRVKGADTLKQLQYLDLNTFMPELILAKVDRASMAHSLEVRVPFLDHELVEYMFSLSDSVYFDPDVQKTILRDFLRGKVPESIYGRRKQGFVGPDKFYMDMELYAQELPDGRLIADGIIRREYVQKLLGDKDHWRLWKLLVLEHWWKIWVD